MDDSLLVRRLEGLGDLAGDGEGLVERERPALQPLGEVLALDELHDEGAHAARLLEAVDRGDVGVLQLGEDLRLALEAGEAVGVRGERLRQDLDRDLALELRVGRPVDDAHAALAERGGDLVGAEARADHRARPSRPGSCVISIRGRRTELLSACGSSTRKRSPSGIAAQRVVRAR